MNNTFKFFKIAVVLTYSITISAGGMDSGGGQGFVCFDSKKVATHVKNNNGNLDDSDVAHITQIETLDLYEARLKRGDIPTAVKLFSRREGENYSSYLERIIARIDNEFPVLADQILKEKNDFSGDHTLWSPIGLTTVSDGLPVISYDSSLCTLTTLAIQFKEDNAQFLNLDPRLFNHPKMSDDGRAILLLHEYLYAVARERGKTSSRSTRMAIGYLLREDIDLKSLTSNLVELNFLNSAD